MDRAFPLPGPEEVIYEAFGLYLGGGGRQIKRPGGALPGPGI